MPKVQGTTIATTAQKLTPPHTVLKMKQKKRNSSSSAILQTFVSKIVMLFMISNQVWFITERYLGKITNLCDN